MVEVVSVTRVPEMTTEDRNRLMVVTPGNRNMKVLRVAKNLRGNDEYQHVFIGADETETAKLHEIIKELRERRGNSE